MRTSRPALGPWPPSEPDYETTASTGCPSTPPRSRGSWPAASARMATGAVGTTSGSRPPRFVVSGSIPINPQRSSRAPRRQPGGTPPPSADSHPTAGSRLSRPPTPSLAGKAPRAIRISRRSRSLSGSATDRTSRPEPSRRARRQACRGTGRPPEMQRAALSRPAFLPRCVPAGGLTDANVGEFLNATLARVPSGFDFCEPLRLLVEWVEEQGYVVTGRAGELYGSVRCPRPDPGSADRRTQAPSTRQDAPGRPPQTA